MNSRGKKKCIICKRFYATTGLNCKACNSYSSLSKQELLVRLLVEMKKFNEVD